MPIYEYECKACGKIDSILQKFSDAAPTTCKICGSGPLHKIMSKTSFVLKGSGWYVTDFKNGSNAAASNDPKIGDEKQEKSDKSDKSEKKTDSDSTAKPAKEKPADCAAPAPSSTTT